MSTMKQARALVERALVERALVERALSERTVVSASLGYGETLFLEFANPNSDETNCKLDTNFATWSLEGAYDADQYRDSKTRLESACQSLLGAVVHSIDVSDDGRLTLRFDGNRVLKVVPWPLENGLSDAWSVALSDARIVAVSNAGQVAVVAKDLPIREWFQG